MAQGGLKKIHKKAKMNRKPGRTKKGGGNGKGQRKKFSGGHHHAQVYRFKKVRSSAAARWRCPLVLLGWRWRLWGLARRLPDAVRVRAEPLGPGAHDDRAGDGGAGHARQLAGPSDQVRPQQLLLASCVLARLQLADEALDGVRRAGAGMDTKPILPKRPNKKNPYVKKPPRPAKDLHPLDAKALKQAAAEYDADSD